MRINRFVSFAMALVVACVTASAASAQSTPTPKNAGPGRHGGSFRGTPEPALIAIAGAIGAGYLALRRKAKKPTSDV
jgi:hypothetical protein